MPDIAQSASTPSRKTAFIKFFSCNPKQDALFAVNADISVDDALNIASCFLASADGIMSRIAEEIDSDACWAAAYLIEMSKAVVDAAATAIVHENSSTRSIKVTPHE